MKALIFIPALCLAACDMAVPPASNPDMPPPVACAADQSLVGQSSDILAAMTFPQGTRIYETGDPVTMDFNPNRLNIEIGPDGQIVAVTCG